MARDWTQLLLLVPCRLLTSPMLLLTLPWVARCQHGLTVRRFQHLPTVQELSCSGDVLSNDMDLLGIKIFSHDSRRTLAYVNVKDKKCSTSGAYSACLIDPREARKSRLVTLLVGWGEEEGEVREYGCNVTAFRPGLIMYSVTWNLTVTKISLSHSLFRGLPSVLQVQCSSETLASDLSVLGMTLYDPQDQTIIVHMNLKDEDCVTGRTYSACFLARPQSGAAADPAEAGAFRVVSLVLDFRWSEARDFGCNVTCFRSGRLLVVSWTLTVNLSNIPISSTISQRISENPTSSKDGRGRVSRSPCMNSPWTSSGETNPPVTSFS